MLPLPDSLVYRYFILRISVTANMMHSSREHKEERKLGYDWSEKTHPRRTPPGKSACTRAPNGIIRTSLINTGFGNCTRSKFNSCK